LLSSDDTNGTAVIPEITDVGQYPHLFPVPYLLFLVGYALVLLVDRIANSGGGDGHDHSNGDDHNHFPDLDQFDDDHEKDEHFEHGHNDHGHHHHHNHAHATVKTEKGVTESTCQVDVVIHCDNPLTTLTRRDSNAPLKKSSAHCDFEVSPENCLDPIVPKYDDKEKN
jgi:uncharacterized protein involved in copper resistance